MAGFCCQTNSYVWPHIGATAHKRSTTGGYKRWAGKKCSSYPTNAQLHPLWGSKPLTMGTAVGRTETEVRRPSRTVDGGEPPQGGHLQLQDADVLGGLPEQHVDVRVPGIRDYLLELPEPPQHHVLEGPPVHQRCHHPLALSHREHGLPSHLSLCLSLSPSLSPGCCVTTDLCCVEDVCWGTQQGGVYIGERQGMFHLAMWGGLGSNL